MKTNRRPYAQAQQAKGFWRSHRFLILRRLSQSLFLAAFLSGPLLGVWIVKGTLASSLTFGALPLTDPFVFLQSLAARHAPDITSALGAAIVFVAYLLLGGRTYCAWVCPINPVADFAGWLRRRFDLPHVARLRPEFRNYLAIAVVATSAAVGLIAWELVNPITAFHRALVFGLWSGLWAVLAILILDLFVAGHGWCGHICPVGAFYGLLGRFSVLRIAAPRRSACDDCMDCFDVCPEPQVIAPALRGAKTGASPIVLSGACTVCGGCVDVCSKNVFAISHRFVTRTEQSAGSGAPFSSSAPPEVVLERIDR